METDRATFYMNKRLDVNGSVYVYNTTTRMESGGMYAPIFYDTDDTTYYTNPANGGFVLQGGTSNRVKF
jgi:hypothetical protein